MSWIKITLKAAINGLRGSFNVRNELNVGTAATTSDVWNTENLIIRKCIKFT